MQSDQSGTKVAHPVGTLQQQRTLHCREMSADYRLEARWWSAQHAKHCIAHVVVPKVVVVITRTLFTLTSEHTTALIQGWQSVHNCKKGR
jgi:hypothetical protein